MNTLSMKEIISVQFLIVMLAIVFHSHIVAYGSIDEVVALLNWKASLQQQNNSVLSSWTSFHPNSKNNSSNESLPVISPCNWYGVSCNKDGRIYRLNLTSSRLTGTLDNFSFLSFPNLTQFELSYNKFYGIIPPAISNLSKLAYLDFIDNQFSGTIPSDIRLLENLHTIHLNKNQLNGSIPHGVCHMKFLFELDLRINFFHGAVPFCFSNMTKLRFIFLSDNELSGSIPYELGNLSELSELHIANNYLEGSIPNTLGSMSMLSVLHLFNNNISGPIPAELGNMSLLQRLSLSDNNLSGSIPNTLGLLRSIIYLYLFSNNLSGPIPDEIGNMTSLVSLQVSNNQLNGSIPKSFGNLLHLEGLFLNNNKFSGSLPEELGNLKLNELEISQNNFSGFLPDTICNSGNLWKLLVGENNLTGKLTKSLFKCSRLVRVRFDRNQLTGNISEIFGVYPDLEYINLSDNEFYGELSDNWSNCTKLTAMQLGGNAIGGIIPPSLGNSTQLEMLNLSFNNLVGEIPEEFEKIKSLGSLFIRNNRLSGALPLGLGSLTKLALLDLSKNKLEGSIPNTLGNCENLYYLNLANNKLNHVIPTEFSKMTHLSILDLSHNLLTSTIPTQIDRMSSLELLNLSHNRLSGFIPKSMEAMNALSTIDISYNDLQGPLPNTKAFLNAPVENFQWNKGLCGNISGLPYCKSYITEAGDDTEKRLKLVLIVSLLLAMSFVLSMYLGVLIFSRRKKQSSTNGLKEDQSTDFIAIFNFKGTETYDDILEATRDFDQAYCIGKGRFGSVYKAELPSNRTVAVKKLHSDSDMIDHNSFLNEVKALTTIRHRNIVNLYGYCAQGKKSFLVYDYLEGGDLYQLLKKEVAQTLDWIKRVDIIKDIAHALSYMHHDCFPPIVHRDISSKNILLNSEYEAFISDFGTAKILNPNTANETAVAGTFGYMAPELSFSIKVTEKCDVYSFGVLAMELVKGEHPGDIITSPLYEKLGLKDLVDRRLPFPVPEIQNVLTSIIILAIECLNANPEMRPTMYDVSQQISAICAGCV